jgi:hypothetical protein
MVVVLKRVSENCFDVLAPVAGHCASFFAKDSVYTQKPFEVTAQQQSYFKKPQFSKPCAVLHLKII